METQENNVCLTNINTVAAISGGFPDSIDFFLLFDMVRSGNLRISCKVFCYQGDL